MADVKSNYGDADPIIIQDTAGNKANVKAASTAAIASDPALVVAISPNTNTVSIAANSSVNLAQIAAVTTATGNGVVGTGVQRVAIASDNTAFAVNATCSGTVSITANSSVNLAQIAGVTTSTGNGIAGTGVQRVTIASDNTAFAVNATLSAETTKVIGVVRNADGSGNLLTSTTNALDINIKSGSIANTTFASTQSGTWTVQPGNTANTTPWLTKIHDGTNAVTGLGADNSSNASIKLPVITARANVAPPAWTEGNQVPLSTDLGGVLRVSEDCLNITGTVAIAATITTQTITLGTMRTPLPDVGVYQLIWAWPATGVTLTSATLRFEDTISSTVDYDYPLNVANTPSSGAFSTISQAASSVATYTGLLTLGTLKTVKLVLNYTGTPSATTATFQLNLFPRSSTSGTFGVTEQVAYLSTAVSTANQVLIGAPGAGLKIYVTSMEGSNAGASLSTCDFKDGSGGTVRYSRAMAASGGGFATNLNSVNGCWTLTANNALVVTPSAAVQQYFSINFFVAP